MKQQLMNCLRNVKHSKGKIYFSETGEDSVLQQLFKSKNGRYIDIGAGQPIIGSNSYCFYKMGWTGICIDPQPDLKLSYKILRPKDLFLPFLVGTNKNNTLYEFENKLLSTTNVKVANYHKSKGLKYTKVQHRCVSLQDYLPRKILPDDNYFISIDVEGSEYEIIKQIDLGNQRPRVILVETWNYPWAKKSQITSYLEYGNYQLFAYTGLTALFVPKELTLKTINMRLNLSKLQNIF
jgi:FkbM family methyltransferase